MEVQPREIRRYIRPDGRIPFLEWYYALRDGKAQVKVDARLERVSLGNLGDYKSEMVSANSGLTTALATGFILDK